MTMLKENELLTEEQTAEFLGLAPITLCNWRSQRRGPAAVKIGRKSFYRRETLMAWIASREGAHRSEEPQKHSQKPVRRGGGAE